ncbi:MAG: hypothetical protein HY682_06940 [Chloroflexi bacterium]|nr:hypothetical protein [Chloroflexota bacterium]
MKNSTIRPANLLRVAARRIRADLGLTIAVAIGVVIAATVLGGVTTYLRSLELVALRSTVDGLGQVRKNIQVTLRRVPFTQQAFAQRDLAIKEATERHIDRFVVGTGSHVRSPYYWWGRGSTDAIQRGPEVSQAVFQRMEAIGSQVRFTVGGPPGRSFVVENGIPVVEVAILESRALEMGVSAGDVIETEAAGNPEARVRALVTGLFEPIDLRNGYWMALGEAILSPTLENQPPILPMLVGHEAPLWAIGEASPGAVAEVRWFLHTDPEDLKESHVADILAAYDTFAADVEVSVPRSSVFSGLDPALNDLERRLLFARIPMFLIGAMLLVVVAYYLFMVAGLLAQKRQQDTVMLRSRGMSALQIGRLYALEGAGVVLIAVIAGPLLAQVLISQLGRLPIYDPVTGGATLPVELSWVAFAWSALAGVVALGILALPAVLRTRRDVVAARGSAGRPASTLWFQRYYLDAAVLVLGGLILWELRTRRTIVTAGLETGQAAVITMLFAPALLMIGVTVAFLRVYPLLVRGLAWVAARRAPAWLALALWRLSRTPFQYSWPILLLVLAAGLAVVASTLASTLERSAGDRAAYESAADILLTGARPSGLTTGTTMEAIRSVPGVADASLALRATGEIGTTGRGNRFELLALEADRFGRISWFRPDFADLTLPELLQNLPAREDPPSIWLPDDAAEIEMWAHADPRVAKLFLWVVLRDEAGRLHTLTLGQVSGGGWEKQSARLPEIFAPPLRIVSILVFEPVSGDAGTPTTVFIDDISTANAAGQSEVVVDFEQRGLWTPLPTSQGFDIGFDLASETGVRSGDIVGRDRGASVAQLTLGRGTDGGVRGVYRSVNRAPIPILASESFLARNGLRVGDRFVGGLSGTLTPMRVVGSTRLFPTLDPRGEGFAVVDLETLMSYAELRGAVSPVGRTFEVFVDTQPERHENALTAVRAVAGPGTGVVDRSGLEAASLIDPLTVAGWRGVGFVAISVTVLVVLLGFGTYLVSYGARTKVESAYLRALGLARPAHLRSIATEQALVAVTGLALGTIAGFLMTRLAVDAVSHTEKGLEVLPPFVIVTEWLPVVFVYSGLAIIAAALLARFARAYTHLPLHILTRREE